MHEMWRKYSDEVERNYSRLINQYTETGMVDPLELFRVSLESQTNGDFITLRPGSISNDFLRPFCREVLETRTLSTNSETLLLQQVRDHGIYLTDDGEDKVKGYLKEEVCNQFLISIDSHFTHHCLEPAIKFQENRGLVAQSLKRVMMQSFPDTTEFPSFPGPLLQAYTEVLSKGYLSVCRLRSVSLCAELQKQIDDYMLALTKPPSSLIMHREQSESPSEPKIISVEMNNLIAAEYISLSEKPRKQYMAELLSSIELAPPSFVESMLPTGKAKERGQ